MKGRRVAKKKSHRILRELTLLLCALLLGVGYSAWRQDVYMPSMDGNVRSMLVQDGAVLMVTTRNGRSCLLRAGQDGTLLNYMDVPKGWMVQDIESDGETVYAILYDRTGGEVRQRLVSCSLKERTMRPGTVTELTALPGAPAGVTWQEVYLPAEGEETPCLRLTGIDSQGQGWLARWNLEERRAGFEKVLTGEKLLFLKYIGENRFIWINRSRETGQFIDGVRQRDLLSGQLDTPLHIAACGTRCFVSDSVSGDIFEILPDGSSALFRSGGARIGGSEFSYQRLEFYTAYLDRDGSVRIAGLCAAGENSAVAGEEWSIQTLYADTLRLELILRHSWPAVAVIWLALSVLIRGGWGMFHSPRLAVRLLLCETAVAVSLLAAVIGIQYNLFQSMIRENAYQKLRLIGGSLAVQLTETGQANGLTADYAVWQMERQVAAALGGQIEEYSVCVIWNTAYGPVIGSDSDMPEGYLVEDVKPRAYFLSVRQALETGRTSLQRIQTDSGFEYLYVEPFVQGGQAGCTAVSQSEEAMMAGRVQFLRRLVPILAACPFLFLFLISLTRRQLKPLDEIRCGLEAFTDESGSQISLDGMPHTELYEMSRVFNHLSLETMIQFNDLKEINAAYLRLMPECFLEMLDRDSVTQLEAGCHAPVDGGLLVLLSQDFSTDWEWLSKLSAAASGPIKEAGGLFVDYGEGLGAVTALFPSAQRAHACARDCLAQLEQEPVMAAVLEETVDLGVLGGGELLYPLAVVQEADRKREILKRVAGFGAVLVQNSVGERQTLRLLGWDGELAIYEDPAWRPVQWQSQWREAAPVWEEALSRFREGCFPQAMRLFANVLRIVPEDIAARRYLLRCDALRRETDGVPDTGLLYDWEESGHG